MGVESLDFSISTPTPALMELLAIRLSPQAGKSLVIPLQGGGGKLANELFGFIQGLAVWQGILFEPGQARPL